MDFKKINLNFGIRIGIVCTLIMGILLRFQFSGLLQLMGSYDWYRVHTHMGYYLFLIPAVLWLGPQPVLRSQPFSAVQRIYYVFALITLVVFFIQGYSLLSKILSGLLYLIWLYSGFSAERTDNQWQIIPRFGFILSLFFLICVITLPRLSSEWDAAVLAKGFLLALFILVILPFVISQELRISQKMNAYIYMLGGFLLAAVSIKILPLSFSMVAVISILAVVFKSQGSFFEKIKWAILFSGMGVLSVLNHPATYQAKIAGLHFIFLGPALLSILKQVATFAWVKIYYLFLGLFCGLIFLSGIFPTYMATINLLIALVGISLLSLILVSWKNQVRKN